MQKHVRQNMGKLTAGISSAGKPLSHGKLRTGGNRARQFSGYQAKIAHRLGERQRATGPLNEQPGKHI
jgi:hypothetical protein